MSKCEITLCCFLLKEFHGAVAEKVGRCLLNAGSEALRAIVSKTCLKLDQVKRCLFTLIQQHIISYEQTKRGTLEYRICITSLIARLRFARYTYCAKLLYGDVAELIVEKLLQHGQLSASRLKDDVTDRLADTNGGGNTSSDVSEQFAILVKTHFIQRCPAVAPREDGQAKTAIPVFINDDQDMYTIPPEAGSRKRKRSSDDVSGQPAKRRCHEQDGGDVSSAKRQKMSEESSAAEIPWRVNYARFDQYLTDQHIVQAVSARIDKRASEVVRTMLRLHEVMSGLPVVATHPISYHEIAKALPREMGIDKEKLDHYLKVLIDDSMNFVFKVDEGGGGMYVVHFQKALKALCESHIESVVQERFGSKCFRIFKLLMIKKQLEQKQIEEFAMIPAKEAKEILYRMFGEQFVTVTELPRTPEHAPSRTFYLFSVNVNQVARMLLERSYKAMYNLILRRENEVKENRRLLEKQQRVEAIVASLEGGEAAAEQRAEIEEMMSPAERLQLARVKHNTNKLEQSELQLEETMFVLNAYLNYSVLK